MHAKQDTIFKLYFIFLQQRSGASAARQRGSPQNDQRLPLGMGSESLSRPANDHCYRQTKRRTGLSSVSELDGNPYSSFRCGLKPVSNCEILMRYFIYCVSYKECLIQRWSESFKQVGCSKHPQNKRDIKD